MKRKLMILTGYRHPSVKLYTPRKNKKKLGFLLGLMTLCIITPCTNWIVPLTLKGISKFNPLWLYK